MSDFTGAHKALYAFWRGFTSDGAPLDVYYSGHVPVVPGTKNTIAPPYITFEVVDNPPFGRTILTATAWFKAASGYNARVRAADFLDQAKQKIQPQGTLLRCDGGFLLLYPNDAAFLTYADDPDDGDIVGARVRYEVHCYK